MDNDTLDKILEAKELIIDIQEILDRDSLKDQEVIDMLYELSDILEEILSE